MNIFKSIAQSFINAALPSIKTALIAEADALASEPKYSAIATMAVPFVTELVSNWTIKL